MSIARRYVVPLTTAADGSATGYTNEVSGRILSIRIVSPSVILGGDALAAGAADVVITGETTGEPILTAANITAPVSFAPRGPTHKVADGAAELYAAGGTNVRDYVAIAGERVKIVVAQGGDTKTADVHVVVE